MQRLIQKFLRDLHAPFVFLGHENSKKKKLHLLYTFVPKIFRYFIFEQWI